MSRRKTTHCKTARESGGVACPAVRPGAAAMTVIGAQSEWPWCFLVGALGDHYRSQKTAHPFR